MYEIVSRFGPHHAPTFRVKVSIRGAGEAEAEGSSKQDAETAAAIALLEKMTMTKRCGLVAVLGAPNAGKSTLVNALVGQKVAIVSPKAQTTRARLMGIAIDGDTQMLLVDTPGIFTPNRRLDRAMVKAAWEGAEDADRVVLVIDAAAKVGPRVEQVIEGVEQRTEPKILVLNKVDIADKGQLADHRPAPRRAAQARADLHGLCDHRRRRRRPQGAPCPPRCPTARGTSPTTS